MKAKLIKRNGAFYLMLCEPTNFPSYKGFNSVDGVISEDLHIIATSAHETYSKAFKLSLKNCEAIERGYDLDELVLELEEHHPNGIYDFKTGEKIGFKLGFQKALEILGDKKFSEDDIVNAHYMGWIDRGESDKIQYPKAKKNYIQSLQQTGWDCIIEMEEIQEIYRDGTTKYERVPKLDAGGCIVLKRKI